MTHPDRVEILPVTTAFGSVLRLDSCRSSDTLQIIKEFYTNQGKHSGSETGIRLLTYSMEQITSGEANWFSASHRPDRAGSG